MRVNPTKAGDIRLRLCEPCTRNAHDINFRLDRDAHKMCEECRAKIMQIVRILLAVGLDAWAMMIVGPAQRAADRKAAADIRRGVHRGLDLKPLIERFWRLDAMRAGRRAPTVTWRAYRHGGSWGTAWIEPHKITMRIAFGATLEGAVETLLHELVHCSLPPRTCHNELFCRRLIACAREAFDLDLDVGALLRTPLHAMPGRINTHPRAIRAYAIDDAIVHYLRASPWFAAFRASTLRAPTTTAAAKVKTP